MPLLVNKETDHEERQQNNVPCCGGWYWPAKGAVKNTEQEAKSELADDERGNSHEDRLQHFAKCFHGVTRLPRCPLPRPILAPIRPSGQQAGGSEHRPKHAANDVCATSVVVCFAVSVPNRVVLFLLPNHRHEE